MSPKLFIEVDAAKELLHELHHERSVYRTELEHTTFDEYKAFYKGKIEVLTSVIERLELIINQNK